VASLPLRTLIWQVVGEKSDKNQCRRWSIVCLDSLKSEYQPLYEYVIKLLIRFQVGVLRTRGNTLSELRAIVDEAGLVGNLTKVKTITGLKDTFLEVFLTRMHHSYKEKTGKIEKQRALADFRATLPTNILSPVWRIRGKIWSPIMSYLS